MKMKWHLHLLQKYLNKYKNKLVYDSNSGEIKDERKHMSMLEDYWLPRREGGRGTEISTLPGGENLGELADVLDDPYKLMIKDQHGDSTSI